MLARALIVLLLVLNLGVAAWWALRPAPAAWSPAPHPAGVARLQLASERDARAVTPRVAASVGETAAPVDAAAAEPPATDQAAPQAAACFRIGPFADTAAATTLQGRLPPEAVAVQLRSEAPRTGNWSVSMPPQADRAAAQALAQRLDAAGFKDYYIIASGTAANGIALGRFGGEEAARRHQAALQAAGFAAQVQPPGGATTAWIDLQATPGFDSRAASLLPAGVRIAGRSCTATP
jgi:hypothetical protein